jgi:hypothetical protein
VRATLEKIMPPEMLSESNSKIPAAGSTAMVCSVNFEKGLLTE